MSPDPSTSQVSPRFCKHFLWVLCQRDKSKNLGNGPSAMSECNSLVQYYHENTAYCFTIIKQSFTHVNTATWEENMSITRQSRSDKKTGNNKYRSQRREGKFANYYFGTLPPSAHRLAMLSSSEGPGSTHSSQPSPHPLEFLCNSERAFFPAEKNWDKRKTGITWQADINTWQATVIISLRAALTHTTLTVAPEEEVKCGPALLYNTYVSKIPRGCASPGIWL